MSADPDRIYGPDGAEIAMWIVEVRFWCWSENCNGRKQKRMVKRSLWRLHGVCCKRCGTWYEADHSCILTTLEILNMSHLE